MSVPAAYDAAVAARAEELVPTLAIPDLEARWLATQLEAEVPDDPDEGLERARRAVRKYEEARRPIVAARTYELITCITQWTGDLDGALRESAQLLGRAERYGLNASVGFAHQWLGEVHLLRWDLQQLEAQVTLIPQWNFFHDLYPAIQAEWSGDLEAAVRHLPERDRAGGFAGYVIQATAHRARILLRAGWLDEARAEFEMWWEIARDLEGPLFFTGFAIEEALSRFAPREVVEQVYRRGNEKSWRRCNMTAVQSKDRVQGLLALHLGLDEDAAAHFSTGLRWAQEQRCPVEHGRCLQGLAEVAARRGHRDEAVEHLDQATALFEHHGTNLFLDQAEARKADLLAASGGRPRYPDGLTAREVEVLQLLAAGKSNREIAGELVISLNTVERHVNHIYTKAGLANRAEAASYAHRQGLAQ